MHLPRRQFSASSSLFSFFLFSLGFFFSAWGYFSLLAWCDKASRNDDALQLCSFACGVKTALLSLFLKAKQKKTKRNNYYFACFLFFGAGAAVLPGIASHGAAQQDVAGRKNGLTPVGATARFYFNFFFFFLLSLPAAARFPLRGPFLHIIT